MSEKDMVDNQANIALTEMRLQFETMAEMQKEERLSIQKMHNEEIEKLCEKHEKENKHWKHIVMGLIATIILIISVIAGSIAYIFANYDFEIEAGYSQSASVGGDGEATIEDGIHFNEN